MTRIVLTVLFVAWLATGVGFAALLLTDWFDERRGRRIIRQAERALRREARR